MRKILIASFAICCLVAVPAAFAVPFGFTDIPDSDNLDIAENFSGALSVSKGKVLFTISNIGTTTSFIRQIYWEFEPDDLLTAGGFSADDSEGIPELGDVNFAWDSPINNPPQGNIINFIADLEARADMGGSGKQGVDAGETAAFLFDGDFNEVLAALNEGSLRIGLHVQGIEPTDGSDSYVNTPPAPVHEPAAMLLLGTGLIGLAGYGRRKTKRK